MSRLHRSLTVAVLELALFQQSLTLKEVVLRGPHREPIRSARSVSGATRLGHRSERPTISCPCDVHFLYFFEHGQLLAWNQSRAFLGSALVALVTAGDARAVIEQTDGSVVPISTGACRGRPTPACRPRSTSVRASPPPRPTTRSRRSSTPRSPRGLLDPQAQQRLREDHRQRSPGGRGLREHLRLVQRQRARLALPDHALHRRARLEPHRRFFRSSSPRAATSAGSSASS